MICGPAIVPSGRLALTHSAARALDSWLPAFDSQVVALGAWSPVSIRP
jgi:hypothetical protein